MHTYLRKYIALVLWLLVVTLPASAQEYWEAAPGPFGGTSVADLEILPDSRILAATANGVFLSDDNGWSWDNFSTGLTSTDVRDILVRTDESVWIATYGAGLFSLNEVEGKWVSSGLPQTFTTSILESDQGQLVAGANGFVYISNDDGTSWQARSMDGFQVNIQALAANSTHLFAASSLGIFRSADAGDSWEFSSFGLQEYDVRSIETDADGNVFAGIAPTSGGCSLYRSRGNGSIWTCVQPTTDPFLVPTIKSRPDGTLYAGGFRSLMKSENEGNSWVSVPVSNTTVEAILITNGEILIGTQGLGVYRSVDGGSSWNDSNAGLKSRISAVYVDMSGRLLAGTEGGLFQSGSYGDSWERIDAQSPLVRQVNDVLVDAEDRIVAGTSGGVWRHTPGSGWEALGPPGLPSIRDLSVRENGNILASYHSGIFEYDGFGWVNWPIQGTDQGYRDISAVHVTSEGSVLAGASWDSWRQESGTNGWTLMSAGSIPWFDVQSFAQDGSTILAGTRYSGVMQSLNDGAVWTTVNAGLNGNEDIQDIQFDQHGRAHIATYGSGVYQQNPWTKAWIPVNYGLEGNHRMIGLAFDEHGNGYAGTVDGGLFRHIVSRSVSNEISQSLPETLHLGALYPNPATIKVNVPLVLPRAGMVRVLVFDLLGREVSKDVQYHSAGATQVSLPVQALPAGSYVLKILTEMDAKYSSFVVMN